MIRQRWAGRIRAAVLVLLAATAPAAADPLFTVADNPVDVTAANAIAARERALGEAQTAAARKLLERLVAPGDVARLPRVPPGQAAAWVQDVEIADERVTPVRYIANVTVRFRPDPVRRFLADQGLAFVERAAAPTLVVPILVQPDGPILFDDRNRWLRAWADRPAGGIAPMTVPLGDLADVSALSATQALSGDRGRLAALARRYGTSRIAVVEARPGPGGAIGVTTTIYDGDGAPATVIESHGDPTGDFAGPVRETAAAIERRWRASAARAPAAAGDTGALLVTAAIGSAEEWAALRRRLAEVPGIDRVDVVAVAPGAGRLRLHHQGGIDQLRAALAQRALRLDEAEGRARLTATGPAPEPATR